MNDEKVFPVFLGLASLVGNTRGQIVFQDFLDGNLRGNASEWVTPVLLVYGMHVSQPELLGFVVAVVLTITAFLGGWIFAQCKD